MELHQGDVILRPMNRSDAGAVTSACQDPEIPRWIPVIPSPYTEEHALEFLERCEQNWESGDLYNFAIVDAGSGELLGSIGMSVRPMSCGHVGYWVAREARGRGTATTALKRLSRWGIEEVGLKRLELVTDPDNRASQRVAEKAGYRREGVLRSSIEYQDGSRRDSVMFSLLPDQLD